MTKSTGLVLGCLGLLTASLAVGWSDAHAVAAAKSAIAELNRRTEAADRQARQAVARISAAAMECRRLESSRAKLKLAKAAHGPSARSASSVASIQLAQRWEKQMQDPKVQIDNLAIARAQLHDQFASLYRALHLTAQQIAEFEANEAAYTARTSDLNAALLTARISTLDPVAVKLFSKLAAENKAAQRMLLGEAGYVAFEEFQRTAIVRGIVSRFAGAATVMGEPLNAMQMDQLVSVIAQADPKYAAGGSAGMAVDWNRALAAAQPILTSGQMDILQNIEPGGGRLWYALDAAAATAAKSDLQTAPAPGSTP